MDTGILEELGLTNAEIKIYLALLEIGKTTAGPILKKTGLQNSVVHMTLDKLVKKGFASYIKKDRVKQYQATDPKNLLKLIDEKKERFQKIMPQLLVRQKKEMQEAEIYEGVKGFKTMLYDFIKDSKKQEEYLFFSFYTRDEETLTKIHIIYKEFAKERLRRGLVVKGVIPFEIKEQFKDRPDYKNLRFAKFPILTNISIFQDKILFTPWEDKPVSYLIHSKQLADSFRVYFYSVWGKL